MDDISIEISNEHQQIIYYGAPGTGKSFKIKDFLKSNNVPEENIFRTTFHPDSDYSTFVGAYKPTMVKTRGQLFEKDELIGKMAEMQKQGGGHIPQRFGAKYWESLDILTATDKKDIIAACGLKNSLAVELDKGIAVGKSMQETRIVYSFVPQSFINAYLQAYSRPNENIYLIIEEINRGNCAQIFGDLFQLLDRNEYGVSDYPIKADTDLRNFIEERLGRNRPGIIGGELSLPANLYIWATMNTSDQSLFPIDSAFKRRWDWKYVPIAEGVDRKTGQKLNWTIDLDGARCKWWDFLNAINKKIFETTNSADKQLGYFFCQADGNGNIDADTFVNKVIFYLWNDVFKDYGFDDEIFVDKEATDEKDRLLSFDKFIGSDGIEVKPNVGIVKKFLSNLGIAVQ